VQALAGTLLPSATVFLVLLCNDREVLGPWVNRPWLNVVATLIVSTLIELSVILVTSTLMPSINVNTLVIALSGVFGLAVIVATVLILRSGTPLPAMSHSEKENWRMPALALLQHPRWSLGRRIAILTLRGYLAVAVILLVVKAVQVAIHH
jgi:hypothetical protein